MHISTQKPKDNLSWGYQNSLSKFVTRLFLHCPRTMGVHGKLCISHISGWERQQPRSLRSDSSGQNAWHLSSGLWQTVSISITLVKRCSVKLQYWCNWLLMAVGGFQDVLNLGEGSEPSERFAAESGNYIWIASWQSRDNLAFSCQRSGCGVWRVKY